MYRFFDEVLDKVLRLPGVTDAAVDDGMPFVGDWAAFVVPVYLQSQPDILYGISSNDPVSLGLAILVLGLAALLACLLPALRATRINPITALRE